MLTTIADGLMEHRPASHPLHPASGGQIQLVLVHQSCEAHHGQPPSFRGVTTTSFSTSSGGAAAIHTISAATSAGGSA